MSAAGIRAGAAFVELSVDESKLIKGLRSALDKVRHLGKELKEFGHGVENIGLFFSGLGGAITGPLTAAAHTFISTGDQLEKMSQRTGISVEALSELAHAAAMSGTDLETVEGVVKRMQRTLALAAGGSLEAKDALAALGLTFQDLQHLAPDQQFEAIARKLAEIQDPAAKTALALKLFGRSGTSILPMLENLGAMREEARRLGVGMSAEDARAASVLEEAMKRLTGVIRSLSIAVGSALAKDLLDWIQVVRGAIAGVRDWVKENKSLVVTALTVGTAIAVVGGLLTSFGFVAIGIGSALTTLTGIASALGGILATLGGIIASVFGAILTPVGLAVAAVVGFGVAVAVQTGSVGQFLGWLGGRFKAFSNFAAGAFQGIKDALAAGDFALAGRILWLSLRIVWQTGVNWLKDLWLDFESWLAVSWDRIITNIANNLALIGHLIPGVDVEAIVRENERQHLEVEDRIQKEKDAGHQKHTEELGGLKQELEALKKQAAEKRSLASLPSEGPERKLVFTLGEGGAALKKELQQKFDVLGTFNAEVVNRLGLGTSSTEERTAKASEETARNTRRMVQQLEEGPVFE